MQMPKQTDDQRKSNELLSLLKKRTFPLGVEGFIEMKDSPTSRNIFKLHNPHRLAVAQDAEQIINVNHSVYKGHYPYFDLLDVEYVREFADDKDRGIIGVYEMEEQISGFLMLVVDREQRKGQYRGLMVVPSKRTKLQVKNRGMETVYQAYTSFYQDVDLWFGETRTAHKIGQRWMEECGSRPCALLPNKDIFTGDGVRESDVLEVVYNKNALYQHRNPDPQLLPQFKDLYQIISQYYGFQTATYQSSPLKITSSFLAEAQKIANECGLSKRKEKYRTQTFIITSPQGATLQFLVNDSISSAEKAQLSETSRVELAGILLYLQSLMDTEHMDYFELYIPVTNVDIQQLFIDLGFCCFGYVPAWQKRNKELDDCLVFGLYRTPIDWAKIRLSENSLKLVETIKPFLNTF